MSTSTSTQLLGLSSFGVASFLKAPIVSLDSDWAADVAFLGVPFDQATGFRTILVSARARSATFR